MDPALLDNLREHHVSTFALDRSGDFDLQTITRHDWLI